MGRRSDPLVVPTRWDLLGFTLGGALVRLCSVGVGFTERSVGRSLRVTYKRVVTSVTILYIFKV